MNSPYHYLLFCKDFADTCVVAKEGENLIGCITGYRPPSRPEVLFIWQVAVSQTARGKGLGVRMLQELVSREALEGVSIMETTVTPSNEPSRRMFAKFARQVGAEVEESECFARTLFPENTHEAEILLKIGPIDRSQLQKELS